MPSVLLTETAGEDLEDLIEKHAPPQDTKDRVRERLGPLERSYRWVLRSKAGWEGARCFLGPWTWMPILYEYAESLDLVVVTTIQDARRADSATGSM